AGNDPREPVGELERDGACHLGGDRDAEIDPNHSGTNVPTTRKFRSQPSPSPLPLPFPFPCPWPRQVCSACLRRPSISSRWPWICCEPSSRASTPSQRPSAKRAQARL